MRKLRSPIEKHFISHLADLLRSDFRTNARLDLAQVDSPDALFHVGGRKIAVELSQIPSDYIVRYFHKPFSMPTGDEELVAERYLVPFEPHRWVHEVLQKKTKRLQRYTKSVDADEYWLVLHPHTVHENPWPMMKTNQHDRNKLELYLMRYGAQIGENFDRVIYFYPDGSAQNISGYGATSVRKLEIDLDYGYPVTASHRLAFRFTIPTYGSAWKIISFPRIEFTDIVIRPDDPKWRGLTPNARNVEISAHLTVGSEFGILQIGDQRIRFGTTQHMGQTMDFAMALLGDINAVEWRAME